MTEEKWLRGVARASRGSLFVTVSVRGKKDRLLPCVLSYWFKKFVYDDPFGGEELPRLKAWHDAIRELRQVVVAQVEITSAESSRQKRFRRIGYVGVYNVSELEIDKPHLRFVRTQRPVLELQ